MNAFYVGGKNPSKKLTAGIFLSLLCIIKIKFLQDTPQKNYVTLSMNQKFDQRCCVLNKENNSGQKYLSLAGRDKKINLPFLQSW